MKHTKGPWKVDGTAIVDAGNNLIGSANGNKDNAQLMASAPDLLEACEQALETFIEMKYDGIAYQKLVEVLEKLK